VVVEPFSNSALVSVVEGFTNNCSTEDELLVGNSTLIENLSRVSTVIHGLPLMGVEASEKLISPNSSRLPLIPQPRGLTQRLITEYASPVIRRNRPMRPLIKAVANNGKSVSSSSKNSRPLSHSCTSIKDSSSTVVQSLAQRSSDIGTHVSPLQPIASRLSASVDVSNGTTKSTAVFNCRSGLRERSLLKKTHADCIGCSRNGCTLVARRSPSCSSKGSSSSL
jgi:hypothetical protein